MREAYEAWFKEKFGFPAMPIHSRVVDFCFEGYQAGVESMRQKIAETKFKSMSTFSTGTPVWSDKQEIQNLRQQLAERDAELKRINNAINDDRVDLTITAAEAITELRQQLTERDK